MHEHWVQFRAAVGDIGVYRPGEQANYVLNISLVCPPDDNPNMLEVMDFLSQYGDVCDMKITIFDGELDLNEED